MEGSDGKIEANMTTCCSKHDKIAYNCKLIYRVVNHRMIFAVYIILDCDIVFKDSYKPSRDDTSILNYISHLEI